MIAPRFSESASSNSAMVRSSICSSLKHRSFSSMHALITCCSSRCWISPSPSKHQTLDVMAIFISVQTCYSLCQIHQRVLYEIRTNIHKFVRSKVDLRSRCEFCVTYVWDLWLTFPLSSCSIIIFSLVPFTSARERNYLVLLLYVAILSFTFSTET